MVERRETLYQRIQNMSVPEKIRLAATGDKEARSLLIRDPIKPVQLAVINNPRIGDDEILTICKLRNVGEDVLRRIASNREWVKLYPVRLALVQNPKTPLTISIRLVPTLMNHDLKILAKSKSVPEAVVQAARRCLFRKQ